MLLLAGVLEVTWAYTMKLSDRLLGTAYAIWTGIGIIGTSVLAAVMFHESFSFVQIICVVFIVISIMGLKLLA